MDIQFGIETEIGISREKTEGLDVVAESIALVRSATAPGVRMRWDYSCEDPHCDARGFRVKELLQDTDEANYFARTPNAPSLFTRLKVIWFCATAPASTTTTLIPSTAPPNALPSWKFFSRITPAMRS